MKANQLAHVPDSDALYKLVPGATLQSAVFLQEDVAKYAGVPSTVTAFGKGFFCYHGDVNAEPASVKVILAMCGLSLEVRLSPFVIYFVSYTEWFWNQYCTLVDQLEAGKATQLGNSKVSMSFLGAAAARSTSNQASSTGKNGPSFATDVGFGQRPAFRLSSDTRPRFSRWGHWSEDDLLPSKKP